MTTTDETTDHGNGQAPPPPPEPAAPEIDVCEFWQSRSSFEHILRWARARRVGPWALLGCILVRVAAATSSKIVLPPLTGGHVSLNLFAGIVAFTGGGGPADDVRWTAVCARSPVDAVFLVQGAPCPLR